MEQNIKKTDDPKISVIVPVYGVEKFIGQCLESIINQTYSNLEIIFVDDASPDKSVEIIETYAQNDSRISIVRHEKNKGLFRARVTGMEVATGEYIAFVDSDDHISCDWFRVLINKILAENADMVIGNTVNEDESHRKTYYNNYRSMAKSNETIRGEAVLEKLLEQEGACFAWHTVWNKLYSKALVEKCMPYFKKIDRHLIMGEDIAYSSIFYSFAESLAFADADAYFYYRHSEASTSLSLPKKKILKNVEDIGFVFQYAEENIKEINPDRFEKLKTKFCLFKDKYFRTWSSNLIACGYANDKEMVATLCSAFDKDSLEKTEPHEFYFYEISTNWTEEYERAKRMIASPSIECVSFDIFDTLIKRAVYEPRDIFYFVAENPEMKPVFSDAQAFCDKRIYAEQCAREKIIQSKSNFEDVTLEEIYNTFCELFGIPERIGERLRQLEEELEYKFCLQRTCAKELFDLAIHMGKKVVLTSDMYLSKHVIERILHKNGYTGYEKLYLSSEQRRLKATGNLFEYMLKDTGIHNRNTVLHIGDNWEVDIKKAQHLGMQVFFIPKCKEVFENKIPAYATNNLSAAFLKNTGNVFDNQHLIKQLPIRCMLAVVVNKLFDNPFQKYLWETDYNADTYLTGYYTLGMHLFGIAAWMYDICKKENYRRIHFLARDGKLLKYVFDEYVSMRGDLSISTEYFYATRKALLPYLIEKKTDFLDINQYINIYNHTPEDILTLYAPILKPTTDEVRREYFKRGIILDKIIRSYREFLNFVEVMQDISCKEEMLVRGNDELKSAFQKYFGEKEAVFDIGYSGRLQKILNRISGKQIDTFYIHQDGNNAHALAKQEGFKIHTFYDFTPAISGIIREFFISDPAPSCIGYNVKSCGEIEAILEDKKFSYQENYSVRKFQQGAYDFCKDMCRIFADELSLFTVRPMDASAAFEYYLLNAKQCDRYVYSNACVEDDVYDGYSSKSIFDIWTWQLNELGKNVAPSASQGKVQQDKESGLFGHERYPFLNGKSKLEKAWFYFWHDRSVFAEKLKFWWKTRKNVWVQ